MNTKVRYGNTLLHLVAQEKQWDIVQELVKQGADINLTNDANERVLDIAEKVQAPEDILRLLRNQMQQSSISGELSVQKNQSDAVLLQKIGTFKIHLPEDPDAKPLRPLDDKTNDPCGFNVNEI